MKRQRASLLANEIVRGSVALVPSGLVKRWIGNGAFDATFFGVSGKAGNPTHDDDAPRRSCNYDAGSYIRGGSHGGDAVPRPEKRFGVSSARPSR